MLLFADDMANFAKTPDELQDHLNNILSYCNSSGLHVNTNKTKVMVFRKRGGVKLNENLSYDYNILEVVDNFNYLGTIFNCTGNFSLNQEYLAGKALKALDILMYNCKRIHLKFLKRLLTSTSTAGVYGELERFLFILQYL